MATRFPVRRVLSGAAAGLLAGLVLHVVLLATGALTPIAAGTFLGTPTAVAGAQFGSSLVLGLGFALLPVTGGWARGLGWGLAYGAVVWLVLDLVVVRVVGGRGLALGAAAFEGLAGRLAWGAALGLAFVFLMVAAYRATRRRQLTSRRAVG
jgi:uncharacterized membrane protein YagU involved in acid resistance